MQPTFFESLHQARVGLDSLRERQEVWGTYENKMYPTQVLVAIHRKITQAVERICFDSDLIQTRDESLPPNAYEIEEYDPKSESGYVVLDYDRSTPLVEAVSNMGHLRSVLDDLAKEFSFQPHPDTRSDLLNVYLERALGYLESTLDELFVFGLKNFHGSQKVDDLFFERSETGASRPTDATVLDANQRLATFAHMKKLDPPKKGGKNLFLDSRRDILEKRLARMRTFLERSREQKTQQDTYIYRMYTLMTVLQNLEKEANRLWSTLGKLRQEHGSQETGSLAVRNTQYQLYYERWSGIVENMKHIMMQLSGPFPFGPVVTFYSGDEWKEGLDATDFHSIGEEWSGKDNVTIYRHDSPDHSYVRSQKRTLDANIADHMQAYQRYVGHILKYASGHQSAQVRMRYSIYIELILREMRVIEKLQRKRIALEEKKSKKKKLKKTQIPIREETTVRLAMTDISDIIGLLSWTQRAFGKHTELSGLLDKVIGCAQGLEDISSRLPSNSAENDEYFTKFWESLERFCHTYAHFRNQAISIAQDNKPKGMIIVSTLYRIENKITVKYYASQDAQFSQMLDMRYIPKEAFEDFE